MSGCIYLYTCLVNRKMYVGQHCNPEPSKRHRAHVTRAKNPKTPFYCAIKSHGIENFKLEVLWVGPLEALNRMEEYYAEVLETYIWDNNPGYNAIWCGGEGGRGKVMSPESRAKISEAVKKRLESAEVRKKMSEQRIGIKRSPETRQKMSEGKKAGWAAKKLAQQALLS